MVNDYIMHYGNRHFGMQYDWPAWLRTFQTLARVSVGTGIMYAGFDLSKIPLVLDGRD